MTGFAPNKCIKDRHSLSKAIIWPIAYSAIIRNVNVKLTTLPSNLRPTTRECVQLYLVTRAHFRSRDKHGGHIIRSIMAENPMLHANFMVLCFIEPEILPIDVLHCGNSSIYPFCSCDLDLDPMTFIYELDKYSLEIYRICKYELHTSRPLKVIVWQTDRWQTDRQTRWPWMTLIAVMASILC